MRKRFEQHGGAALEYLIVSACALMMGLAAAGFVGKIFQDKIQQVSQTMDERWGEGWSDWEAP